MTATPSLNQQLATEIRVQLARKNLQQNALARMCGWTPSSLSRRMTGEIPFSTEDIETIAKELGLEPEKLMWPVTR